MEYRRGLLFEEAPFLFVSPFFAVPCQSLLCLASSFLRDERFTPKTPSRNRLGTAAPALEMIFSRVRSMRARGRRVTSTLTCDSRTSSTTARLRAGCGSSKARATEAQAAGLTNRKICRRSTRRAFGSACEQTDVRIGPASECPADYVHRAY